MEHANTKLYQEIIRNFSRLSPDIDLADFLETYLFDNVTPSVIIAHMQEGNAGKLHGDSLEEYSRTKSVMLMILGCLIRSNTWQDFEAIYASEHSGSDLNKTV